MDSKNIPNYDFLESTPEDITRAIESLLSDGQGSAGSKRSKGWLYAPLNSRLSLTSMEEFVQLQELAGVKYQYVMGMGGSVSGSAVLTENPFNQSELKTFYLDSNHPRFIEEIMSNVDFYTSRFVVCSKSGTTKETLTLFKYFFDQCINELGNEETKKRFFSVTDPDSPLQTLSEDMNIRVIHSDRDIGGRFSILSSLSIIPALMSGVDLAEIIRGSESAMVRCLGTKPDEEIEYRVEYLLNCLKDSRDKLSIYVPRSLESFGLWLVQLIAESLGKNQVGFIPVLRYLQDDEDMNLYDDECCLIINDGSIEQSVCRSSEKKLTRYTEVMEIGIHDAEKLGQELYYWEFSVALIGLMMGINPFNQPDVELSKRIFEEIESRSEDWFGAPLFENSIEDTFEQISTEVEFGKYIAILPYLNPSDRCREVFEKLRSRLESYFHVPVVLDFGPRYLHSTGQLFKGGPLSGVFIQILEKGHQDKLKSNELIESYAQMVFQARSDYEAMEKLGRSVCRIYIPFDDLELVQNSVNYMG